MLGNEDLERTSVVEVELRESKASFGAGFCAWQGSKGSSLLGSTDLVGKAPSRNQIICLAARCYKKHPFS